ncbi:MAG: hypothetical protein OES57_15675, partial [Acidimicrobiia bacterium]|nr:hypothetical protein [Acidimicrobiia bacterium]
AVSAVAIDGRDTASAPNATTTTVDLDRLQDEVAAAFLGDWHRWRGLDVVVTSTFARERPDGDRLESDMVVVQLGADRVVSRLGGAEGYIDGDRLRCVPESDGSTRCDRTPTGLTAEELIDGELETWAEYLSGVPPYYRILRTDDGCYELVLTRALPAADFGSVARFCFDEASGALARTRIEYANGLIETNQATLIDLEADPALLDELQRRPAGG